MTAFSYTASAQVIHFGAGTLERLPTAVAAFGWGRVGVITTGSARRGGRAAQVEALLAERHAFTFDAAQPHVPAAQVSEVAALAAANEADALLALGGGSAIGLAKAVSLSLEAPGGVPLPNAQPRVPVAAIPTTYAGSEMTAVVGVTEPDNAGGARKVTRSDPRLAPKLVVYDPLLTLDLPPEITAATGINALAHCVEAVYSTTRNPLSTAAALAGAGYIARALPVCVAEGNNLSARAEMLLGAHLAGASLATVSMGLHHGLCHVLGGTVGVPHGVANAIILPHAMRFNLDTVTPELAQIGRAINAAPPAADASAAEAAIESVARLVSRLGLPQRLRDAGVPRADLLRLAALAAQSGAVRANPKPVTVADAERLFAEAW
jgi:alcohol dehydrogenase class IV